MRKYRRLCGWVLGAVLALSWFIAGAQPAGAAHRTVTLTIVTVPHLPSARFSFDGQVVRADYKGIVRLDVLTSRAHHQLRLLTPNVNTGDTQAQFVRWWGQPNHDEDYKPTLTALVVEQSLRLQVAFRVSYLVRYRVVSQNHQTIDPRRIDGVVIASDTGNLITTHGGQVRLIGYRPALQNGTMAERQAVFSLWAVNIDGSNAVHQGQKRFLPSLARDRNLEFVVQLKSIHISAADRLFGQSVGTGVEVTFPNHTSISIPFGKGHEITIRNLVRGNYKIHLINSHGIGGTRPVALSRNQNVVMKVWNLTDLVAVVLVLLVIAGVSLLGGRLGQPRRRGPRPSRERVR